MLHDILLILWFFLPAAYANMAPVFASKIPGLKGWSVPIDGGKTFRGKRVFGANKTWRGLISGMVLATIVLWLQQLATGQWQWAQNITGGINYTDLPTLILGPLLGLGALGGDAIESFFKRQRGIESGTSWVPFDQLDFVIGAILVSLPFVRLSLWQYAVTLILGLGGHLLIAYIGWLLKLKDRPI